MRVLILGLLFSFNLISAEYMTSFDDGHYLGSGFWTDNHDNYGEYQTHVEFFADEMRADYAWVDGDSSVEISFYFTVDGWFDVIYGGYYVGQGFCMERQCQYEMFFNGVRVNETFTFYGEALGKLGYKKEGNRFVRWEEYLQRIDMDNPDPVDPDDPDASNPVDPADPIEPDPMDPIEPEPIEPIDPEPVDPEDPITCPDETNAAILKENFPDFR